MQCPVCRAQAENLTPNTLEGVIVGCAQCGSYRISGVAFHDFMRLQGEQRLAALAQARLASTSGWPIIGTTAVTSSRAPPRA